MIPILGQKKPTELGVVAQACNSVYGKQDRRTESSRTAWPTPTYKKKKKKKKRKKPINVRVNISTRGYGDPN
jgi:hypothetical protein